MLISFAEVCEKAAVPLCPLVHVLPKCYARNIVLANTMIFQIGTAFIQIAALGVLIIIILTVRSRFTAVGRREILSFFYYYGLLTFLSLVLDTGVVPSQSKSYPYFVAGQCGLSSITIWSLMINGFVGFQLYEDGTRASMAVLHITSWIYGAITFVIALGTFLSWSTKLHLDSSLSGQHFYNGTTPLFVLLYIVNAILIGLYIICQFILVAFTLHDKWALGSIFLGSSVFIAGQVILYGFGTIVCSKTKHYIDGIFFGTLGNLFAVMMVYKLWDSITREDLEFSVCTYDEKDQNIVQPCRNGNIKINDNSNNLNVYEKNNEDINDSSLAKNDLNANLNAKNDSNTYTNLEGYYVEAED